MEQIFETYNEELSKFEYISKVVGSRADYVQGGGGNTSVKLNDSVMAVKASGYRLSQISRLDGYVLVNYSNIKNYFVNMHYPCRISSEQLDKEGNSIVKENIIKAEGLKELRPSVEAGFHSLLGKYVIHTHSVYANILCCSDTGEELVETIFKHSPIKCMWVEYTNPGSMLTLKISYLLNEFKRLHDSLPDAVFMENHGLIVVSDDADKVLAIHEQINEKIINLLNIKCCFPVPSLRQIEYCGNDSHDFNAKFESDNVELSEMIINNEIDEEFIKNIKLYPDQIVYLNQNIEMDESTKKIYIDKYTGCVIYNTTENEAKTIHETLLGYAYVINSIKDAGLNIKTMNSEGVAFINSWESEKYRKNLTK